MQVRASTDNVPQDGKNPQWRIGQSSIFAHALGLAPFKDNERFWNEAIQLPLERGTEEERAETARYLAPIIQSCMCRSTKEDLSLPGYTRHEGRR